MQFNSIQRVSKFNSYKNKKSIKNLLNEHHRELENYKNDVNKNLRNLNYTFKNFNEFEYNEILENSEKISNNSKDVSFFYLSIVPNEFEHITGVNISYLLTREEWKNLYQAQFDIIKKFIPNTMIMSSVLHMDENTPHMQLMVLHREEKNIEEKTEDQEIDMLKINNAMKKQFSRLNQKNENLEPKSQEYKEALEKFKKENLERYIEKEKKRKAKKQIEENEKKYSYTPSKNFFNQENSFEKLNEIVFNELKENEILKKLQTNMAKLSEEMAEFVPRRDETIESKAKDIKSLKKEFKQELEALKYKLQIGTISENEENKLINIAIKEKMIEEKKNISLDQYLENEKKYSNTEYLKAIRVDRKEILDNLLNENKDLRKERLELKKEISKQVDFLNDIEPVEKNLEIIEKLRKLPKKTLGVTTIDTKELENGLNLLSKENLNELAYKKALNLKESEIKALNEEKEKLFKENIELKDRLSTYKYFHSYLEKKFPKFKDILDKAKEFLENTKYFTIYRSSLYEKELNQALNLKAEEKNKNLDKNFEK
ncbi:plasmid recombination protein [Streptobacillus felis]|uniref:plasmid recombination protein n=2 Tax=Streptobacillus TaxID=34104 RepID=UPI0008368520|nr:plasmid recombination protein [Streptobacillus felis]